MGKVGGGDGVEHVEHHLEGAAVYLDDPIEREAVEDAERETQRDSRKFLIGGGVGEHRTEGCERVVEEPFLHLTNRS